jgi:mono/diheme cytochrome c family protein/uncharacterized membrane protein
MNGLENLIVTVAAVSPQWVQALGRFHVVIVHFPIALLLLAGMAELWRSIRRSKQASPLAIVCLVIGGLAAIVSSVLGWIHKGFTGFAAEGGFTLNLHQWLGIAAASAAVVALATLFIVRLRNRPLWPYRLATITCAFLVAAAGHFGGTLTHGDGYLTELLTSPAAKLAGQSPQVAQGSAMMPISFPTNGKIVFARDVEPILQQTCLDCHGPAKHRANLRLDTKDVTLKGGANGPAVVPGKSKDSLLVKHVMALDGKKRMPMGHEPLTDVQVKILTAWIDQGADWPETATIASNDQKVHWAYVKPVRPELPAVNDRAWPKNAIDSFVLAKLEKENLKPSPEADRITLIRRVSLDLIGLPPTPQEVDAFVNDPDPNAYDKLVNRLLSSPHYGERWGRHWLDIARYADTNGYEKDNVRVIWPYRDWVINAINRDVTFDQFIVQQIAGDMLPGATDEDRIATGFHRNTMFNEEGGIDVEEFRYKAVIDRVQTTSTALLGLTVHCAQCHNHKYDDISQKEYFQLFSFLNNADEPYMQVKSPEVTEQRRQIQERVVQLTSELASKFPARDDATKFEVLSPDMFATAKKSRLALLSDQSLLASGKNPVGDTYTIEANANIDGVSVFKLEVLTDPSLPQNGPGRALNGNFVLSQFKVEQVDINADGDETGPRSRIKIDRAEADYSQPQFEVAKSIDEFFTNGWAVGMGGDNKPHAAMFFTPDKLAGNKKLIVTLRQEFKNHNLGRFRLSVGRPPAPPTTQPTEADRAKFLAQKIDEWENSVKAKCANWTILDPSRFTRRHDATITKLPDKSLLFTGDNFYREEYKLEYDTDAKDITAIRVELLPHEELPKGGPGRDPNGGCLVSELTAIAAEKKPASTQPTTRPIEFSAATADVGADSVARAIDGKLDAHWIVPGGAAPRTAVFKLKEPLKAFAGGTTLKLSVVQNQFSEISVGRMRISVTSDEKAGEAPAAPDDVERIILTPKEKRSPEQIARLREHFLTSVTPLLAPQQQEIAAVKASMPAYTTTLVMHERAKPRVTVIHHRGEFLQPTDQVVEPGVLSTLPPLPKGAPRTRLTFAKWLVDENNPLVGRVVMNRIWTIYFGRGIVNTIEDFGIMGERPSHPQLLDWLATEFVRQNWSMKAMHRLIVTSTTYRQASRLTPDLQKRDPLNVLLARGPRFRVEAETIRDIALASSGLLNEKIGGPSVFPPQPAGISELSYGPLKWVESPGGDRYRRGMYTFLKRTAMYPAMTTFDGPTADVVCARRIKSNTPLQALTTLNDEVYVEAAQALAQRVMKEVPDDVAGRAAQVFRLCVARRPNDAELKALVDFYQSQLTRFQEKKLDPAAVALADPKRKPGDMDLPQLAAWTTVARSVLNLDETVTKE